MLDEGPSTGLQFLLAAAAAGSPTAASVAGPLAVVVICLFLSALFSGAEAGFLALSRLQVLELEEQGHPRAKLLLRIIEKPAELVSALLIANTTVNVLIAILWGMVVSVVLAPWATTPGMEYAQLFLQIVVLTLIVVILAEVTPKAWAHNFPLQFCTAVAPLIAPVITISAPAVAVFQTLANGILRLFGIRS
ncbi:MAG TPA: DUF21 domain-containing protein, partial [bacterium]|nr:DUF21 domain-containing protein [bacterium]